MVNPTKNSCISLLKKLKKQLKVQHYFSYAARLIT
jgi:hypothetical protein